MKKIIWAIVLIVLGVVGFLIFNNSPKEGSVNTPVNTGEKKQIVYAVHWLNDDQINGIYENGVLKHKGLKQYLDEYNSLNQNVEVVIKQISYGEYANTLKVLSDSDMAPDIYQIYAPWGVSYVKSGMLATPPKDIIDDVNKNYISTSGVTIDGKIWGIPSEINTFVMLYNKDLFKEAGLVDGNGNVLYPKTWNELVNTAVKLTKKDSKGLISQYGIAFLGEDWQVVDPFLSLLYSNGGKYLADDFSKALFNSKEGIEALDALSQVFKKGATSINGNFFDFGKGKVAMVIAPPWTKGGFASVFGDKFSSVVGVAPLPMLKKQAATGYSWFIGVMEKSSNKDESWKFLKWFTSDIQKNSGTSRYGDLLANTIGAIPSRKVDFEKHKEVLGDFFTSVYVSQMKNAVYEPNVLGASNIKSVLMKEILNVWAGAKTSEKALNDAATEVNKILLVK